MEKTVSTVGKFFQSPSNGLSVSPILLCLCFSVLQWKPEHFPSSRSRAKRFGMGGFKVRAFYNPIEDPIVKEALKVFPLQPIFWKRRKC